MSFVLGPCFAMQYFVSFLALKRELVTLLFCFLIPCDVAVIVLCLGVVGYCKFGNLREGLFSRISEVSRK